MFLNGPTTASTTGRSRDERTETRSSSSAAQANIIQSLLNESLFQPADEFVRGNGKRFRATMARLGFQLAGGRGLPPRHVSEAIELLHAGSLIIDDVEDQTHLRRGKPAVHEQIGIPLAINTGNWLYFAALDQLTCGSFGDSPDVLQEALRTIRICHEGQAVDLAARVDEIDPTHFREIAATISLRKTGALMGFAAWLGARAATRGSLMAGPIRQFASTLGIALQMLNDLGELARPNPRLDDLVNRRVTWPWAWLAETANCELVERLRHRLGQPAPSGMSNPETLHDVASCLVQHVKTAGQKDINQTLQQATLELQALEVTDALMREIRELISRLETSYE